MTSKFLPTYEGGESIAVKMLRDLQIDNKTYLSGKKYKISYLVAKELAKQGYCVYVIRPQDWFKEELEYEKP